MFSFSVLCVDAENNRTTKPLIKDKVLFQTEKIIRKLTGIPLGTVMFVMRKLYIIEVKGLGLGS